MARLVPPAEGAEAPLEPHLPVAKVRELLGGISKSFIYAEARAGKLHPVRLGRRLLFAESEIARYLQAHRTEGGR